MHKSNFNEINYLDGHMQFIFYSPLDAKKKLKSIGFTQDKYFWGVLIKLY